MPPSLGGPWTAIIVLYGDVDAAQREGFLNRMFRRLGIFAHTLARRANNLIHLSRILPDFEHLAASIDTISRIEKFAERAHFATISSHMCLKRVEVHLYLT